MKNNNNKIYLIGGLFLVLGFLIGFLVFTATSNVGDARYFTETSIPNKVIYDTSGSEPVKIELIETIQRDLKPESSWFYINHQFCYNEYPGPPFDDYLNCMAGFGHVVTITVTSGISK